MRALLLIAIAGCYNPTSYQPCHTVCQSDEGCTPGFVCGTNGYCRPSNIGDCSPTQDSMLIDADIDAPPPGSLCFGTGFIKGYCFAPSEIPAADLTLPARVDTDVIACSKVLVQIGNMAPPVCVMTGRSYTLAANTTVRVVGSRPLAIITTQGITIAGILDASSTRDEKGPGTVSGGILCGVGALGENSVGMMTGGGGGGGGALSKGGGQGGTGSGLKAGGPGGLQRTVTFIRGGCDGGRGGDDQGSNPGSGGFGGGAVYLLTNGTLSVGGQINASGAGGNAPGPHAGGGGGGSGGFIGLDAMTFSIVPAARIFASGGSGASGGGATSSGVIGGIAMMGNDPGPTGGGDGGGTGGSGSAVSDGGIGEDAQGSSGGGGGGGGGAGFVGYAGPYNTGTTTTTVRPIARLML